MGACKFLFGTLNLSVHISVNVLSIQVGHYMMVAVAYNNEQMFVL